MKQIYIEWRDAVGKSHHTEPDGDRPKSVVLRGIPWIVDEDKDDMITAAYSAADGGFMDMVAIPKVSVEKTVDLCDKCKRAFGV